MYNYTNNLGGGGQEELGLNIQQVIKKKQNKNSFSLGGKKKKCKPFFGEAEKKNQSQCMSKCQ